jgi:hypothetical protein
MLNSIISIKNYLIVIKKHTFEDINIYYLCVYNKKKDFCYIQKIFLFDQQHYINLHCNIFNITYLINLVELTDI